MKFLRFHKIIVAYLTLNNQNNKLCIFSSILQFLRKIHECTLKIRILIALMGEFISLKNVCHINFLSFIISFDLLLSKKSFFTHKLVRYYFLLIVKFIHSEKAIKVCEISTVDLTITE